MSTKTATYYNFSKGRVPIRNTADYSPFGVQLDGRTIQGDFYRRGFNGMEKDDEVKGGGNSYDFGARMYDGRVGRFLSLDAYASKFASQSPYCFAGNTPIWAIDVNGDSVWVYSNTIDKSYGVGRHMFMRVKTGDIDVLIEMSGPANGSKVGQVKVSKWNSSQLTSRSNVMFHQVWEPVVKNDPDKFERDILKYATYIECQNSYSKDPKNETRSIVESNPILPNYETYTRNSNGFVKSLIEFAGGNVETQNWYFGNIIPEYLPGAEWENIRPYFDLLEDRFTKDEYYLNTFGVTNKQYKLLGQLSQSVLDKKDSTNDPTNSSDNTKVNFSSKKIPLPKEKKQKKSGDENK